MKHDLLNILACPVCKGELKLDVGEENEQEVVSGSLYCPKCDARYPIADTIYNLLTCCHQTSNVNQVYR